MSEKRKHVSLLNGIESISNIQGQEVITFHDGKHALDGIEPRRIRRHEQEVSTAFACKVGHLL